MADPDKQIAYLAAALKAPRIREAAARLADQARDAGWTHEEYLSPCSTARSPPATPPGAQLRIRAAGFPARKTLEEFNFDHQPALRRDDIAPWPPAPILTEARNVVLLGPPGTGKTHLAIGLGHRRLPRRPPGPVRHRHRLGRPTPRRPPTRPATRRTRPGSAATD